MNEQVNCSVALPRRCWTGIRVEGRAAKTLPPTDQSLRLAGCGIVSAVSRTCNHTPTTSVGGRVREKENYGAITGDQHEYSTAPARRSRERFASSGLDEYRLLDRQGLLIAFPESLRGGADEIAVEWVGASRP